MEQRWLDGGLVSCGGSARRAFQRALRLTRVLPLAAAVACTPSQTQPSEAAPSASAEVSGSASRASKEPAASDAEETPRERHQYYTRGVHNDVGCDPPERCIAKRAPGQPSDPLYPAYWTSEWTMYRVFDGYKEHPPPYGSPPSGLEPSDYEVSYGASYYDSEYIPADKDGSGAMMEHYVDRCLPIFPGSNHYTCSFVSLGNKAYFLRYENITADTPACCQFSLDNHPPRRDFIKHLPYDAKQSAHLGNTLQAYSIVVEPHDILFGYAFFNQPAPDTFDTSAPPYRHPQSFFFSGFFVPHTETPPNAPIVSQNYTNFRMQRPDPAKTWDEVARVCTGDIQWCCLFPDDCPKGKSTVGAAAPTWGSLEP